MEFVERFSGIQDKREDIFRELRESDIPLILYGGGPNSLIAKRVLEDNGITVSMHCADAEYISKRPDLFPIENITEKFSRFNVFIGVLDYMSVYEKVKNISGICNTYYCDLHEYISSRKPFTKDFLLEHSDALDEIFKMLGDQLSRECFIAFIKARIIGDFSYIAEKYDKSIKPYFDSGVIKLSTKECFVDCGAYTGDTIRDLIEISGSKEHRVFAFEPESANLKSLNEFVKSQKLQNIMIVPKGCWDKQDTLSFNVCGDKSSVNTEGTSSIDVDSIDNLLFNEPVSFIKMDIEGSEYKALLGAKRVIQKNKPKLAISLYHKNEDLFKLPKLISTIYSEYKFYVRIHSCATHEFILYATID